MKYKLLGGPHDGWTMIDSQNKYWNATKEATSYGVVDRNTILRTESRQIYDDSLQALFEKTVLFYLPIHPVAAEEIHIFNDISVYRYYGRLKRLKITHNIAFSTVITTTTPSRWQLKDNKWQIRDYSASHAYYKKSKYRYQYSGTVHSLVLQPEVF